MTLVSNLEPPHRAAPNIQKHRYERRRLRVQVCDVSRVSPGMIRIVVAGDDLADFASLGFDDHLKLLVSDGGGYEARDYTPRRFDARRRRLTLDFAVHEAGPATRWALEAKIGDAVEIAGPKGSTVISPPSRSWLLVGDETALPAIGRHIEEAAASTRITSLVAVAGPEEEQAFTSRAAVTAVWAHRPLSAAGDARPLLDRLEALTVSPDTFVWVAAEAGVARAVRAHLAARGQPPQFTKAAGYWVRGRTDAHERIA